MVEVELSAEVYAEFEAEAKRRNATVQALFDEVARSLIKK